MKRFLVVSVSMFCLALMAYGQDNSGTYQNGGANRNNPSKNLGWYAGFELGGPTTTDWLVGHFSDGVPTRCDGWLAGGDPNGAGCAEYNDVWETEIETDPGMTGGFYAGYGWHIGNDWQLRVEGDYVRRQMGGDSTFGDSLSTTKAGEFALTWEQIEDIRINQFGVNAIVERPITDRITPYAGAGFAGVYADFKYQSVWHRHPDAAEYFDLANAAEEGRLPNMAIAESAGGTVSFGDFEFSDGNSDLTLAGQVLMGVNFKLDDNSSIGLKTRYTRFPVAGAAPLTTTGHEWTPLRSHDSSTEPGGEPVLYRGTIGSWYNLDMSGTLEDDPRGTGIWDVTASYTYSFGN